MSGKTSFDLYKRALSSFQLFISGLSEIVTWAQSFSIGNRIVSMFKISVSPQALVRIKTNVLTAFITSDGLYPTIEVKLLLTAAAKLQKKLYGDVLLKARNIYTIHFIYRAIVDGGGVKLRFRNVFTISNFRFRTLSYFDGSTLGSLDSLTLGDMDQGV